METWRGVIKIGREDWTGDENGEEKVKREEKTEDVRRFLRKPGG